MIKSILSAILVIFFFASSTTLHSQVMTAEQARVELEKQGIDYDELDRRLLKKNIDIKNMPPEELVKHQAVIEEVTTEMLVEVEKVKEAEVDKQRGVTKKKENEEKIERSTVRGLDSIPEKEQIVIDSLNEIAINDSLMALEEEAEKEIRTYGQHLFVNQAIPVFEPDQQILPTNAYKLGTGDEVAISIFGSSQFEGKFPIDDGGYIYPPRMPRIFLKGLSLSAAREKMAKVFKNYYRFNNGEFNAHVSSIRNVTIGVFGEAEKIGSYSLTATNTAFNAIAAAGGPTEIGSVRKIRLHRGEEIKYIDIYAFMSNPSVAHDFYLEDNDIIQIPEAEKLVSISGEVKKPFLFELLPDENLTDLLRFAGGITDNAYTDNIQIRRKTQDGIRLLDVNLTDVMARRGDFGLNPGDDVIVRPLRQEMSRIVYIEGQVNYPGQFSLGNQMNVLDLIKKGGLNKYSREDFAILSHLNSDSTYITETINIKNILDNPSSNENVALKEGDRLRIFATSAFAENYSIEVEGNVRIPGKYPLDNLKSLRVSDAILLSAGINPNVFEKAMILRTPVDNPKNKKWISFNIINALADVNSADNLFLEPQDKIIVYSLDDFEDEYQLTTDGAVREKAEFPYGQGIRITDLIIMSGGLHPDASDKGYIVRYNLSNKNEEFYIPVNIDMAISSPGSDADILLDKGDRLFVFSTTEMTDQFPVNINGEVRNPGEYIYSPTMSLKSILLLAGGLKFSAATNRVEIFRLIFNENNPVEKALVTVQVDKDLNIIGQEDIVLKPFDIVVIRRIPGFEFHETVFLEGELIYPGTYPLLNDNERVTDLIERCGGFTKKAFLPAAKLFRKEDDKGFVVIRLDEIMRNKNSAMNIRLKNGDKLIVPKSEELVVIKGEVDLESALLDGIAKAGKINVAFIGKKRAMHYINQFTGGLGPNATKRQIKVKYPNGAINKTKNFLFINSTPRVEAGAEIIVDVKPPEVIKELEQKEREQVDWGKVVSNSIAQAGAILSLILLIQQVD